MEKHVRRPIRQKGRHRKWIRLGCLLSVTVLLIYVFVFFGLYCREKIEETESASWAGGKTVAFSDMNSASAKASGDQVRRVYLTFDDGPSEYTDQILDILARNQVKATFFVVGKEEEQYYDDYRRIVEEGHTIGLHSYSHIYKEFYRSEESFAEDLNKLDDLIYKLTGTRCRIFRFPGGSSNQVCPLPIQNYIAYLNKKHIRYYDWNSLNGDAVTNGLTPEQLVQNIMRDVEKNQDSIVLMHDLRTTHATVESLQLLINTLQSEGFEILPIDEETPLIQHVSYKSAMTEEE